MKQIKKTIINNEEYYLVKHGYNEVVLKSFEEATKMLLKISYCGLSEKLKMQGISTQLMQKKLKWRGINSCYQFIEKYGLNEALKIFYMKTKEAREYIKTNNYQSIFKNKNRAKIKIKNINSQLYNTKI